jgi:sigma-B regulation protein RsbQ
MSRASKLNAKMVGKGSPTLVFVHGYGCDQNMWRFVAPAFSGSHRCVFYDLVGMGGSDYASYSLDRYASLEAHAEDLDALLEELEIDDAVLVGHSVGATIACLTSLRGSDRIRALALVAPSPSFINDSDYVGGFDRASIEGLIGLMEQNFLGWTEQIAPVISGQVSDGETTEELSRSFCRTDPSIAKHFGRVTFLADHRREMAQVTLPTLVLQCRNDALAPVEVGQWLAARMARAELKIIEATGHCPHLTDPEKTVEALRGFLEGGA